MLSKKTLKTKPAGGKKPDIIIGIDPDSEKNGVAFFEKKTKRLEATTLTFPELLDYIRQENRKALEADLRLVVIIEAGWLNKTHWHLNPFDSRQKCAKIGNDVGRNHETGRKIAEMLDHWGILHEEIKPLPLKAGGMNLWAGKDGKITAEELKALTGLTGRTNQEARDAALIAWWSAGEPITIGRAR